MIASKTIDCTSTVRSQYGARTEEALPRRCPSRARFVGHRPGTEIRWQANHHLWFQADYGIFYAGRFLKETQPGRNLNYWALWAGYKF